jgi:S-adenosylmethionine decarboxylase
MTQGPIALGHGAEWIVDAYGCSPQALQSESALGEVFARLVRELELHPIGETRFHTFPAPGGVTGLLLLTESHLACHTFPETGYCAINLYCCRPRPEWPWSERLSEMLGASRVEARVLPRPGHGGPR